MKTDALWIMAFVLGFVFAFAVLNSAPGLGLFLGVNTLVGALWYFGMKNAEAKELPETKASVWLLKLLTGLYVLLTIPYLYRLDDTIIVFLVMYHVAFLVIGALYFALPSALHIIDILTIILSPIIFLVTWLIEAFKSVVELFKENANIVKLLLKVVLYSAASLLVFILFAKLLSAADAEFKVRIDTILEKLDLVEVMGRTVVAVIMSFVAAGLLAVVGTSKVLPMLGTTLNRAKELWDKAFSVVMAKRSDALLPVIITTPVLFLFAMYVWVQFSYLFGQDVTEILAKFSFASYARRGFTELLVVGALTYPLLAWSMSQAKSEWKVPRIASFVINTGIVSAMWVMLYSLVVRMNLYMTAYGPSVLRYYVVVGAVFVGIALLAYEVIAVAKAAKPGFAIFKGRLMTDYMIVAVLTALGLLGALSLFPWNNYVGRQILSAYESEQRIDVSQVVKLPLESSGLVFQIGKTLEADGLKESGLLLQAHAAQEVSTYKKLREDSIFTNLFGFNFLGSSILREVDTAQLTELTTRFKTSMETKVTAISNSFVEALIANDFSAARALFDPKMKENDIAGFASGIYVSRGFSSTSGYKDDKFLYFESMLHGATTTSTTDILNVMRLTDKSEETSISTTYGFRNGKVVIVDSSLILSYLPDAISDSAYAYEVSAYGYRNFCKVPTLDVIYSETMGCEKTGMEGEARPIVKPEDSLLYQPMGIFKKSDFVTKSQE